MRVTLVQWALLFWALGILAIGTSVYARQAEAFVAGTLATVMAMLVIIDLLHPERGIL